MCCQNSPIDGRTGRALSLCMRHALLAREGGGGEIEKHDDMSGKPWQHFGGDGGGEGGEGLFLEFQYKKPMSHKKK